MIIRAEIVFVIVIILFHIFFIIIGENVYEKNELELIGTNALNRTSRDFPWFGFVWGLGLIRFLNGECDAGSGFSGTCYTRRECRHLAGSSLAFCANRAGVCCVFQKTCGESSDLNNTYFVSPQFPSTYTGGSICTFTIIKQPDACQVRLDFQTLNLAQPNQEGVCVTDALVITGSGSTVPILCGDNSGQHVYLEFAGNSSITISVYVKPATVSRSWNIKIAQINCNCPWRAPSGCLQYYQTVSGTVKSFNFGSSSILYGTRQLANTNYGICVAMQPGYCGIQWTPTSDPYSFTLTGSTPGAVQDGSIGTEAAALSGSLCTTDFVVIPAPISNTNNTPLNTDRFCGNAFISVTSYSKPFVLTTVTNGAEYNPAATDQMPSDEGNRGFALSFTQVPCDTFTYFGR